jgi:hypothetical protein
MAPLHGGSSAGKSDLCCGRSLNVVGRPGLHQSGLMSTCFADCPSPGPRKNDLTIYWALGPFVRSFTLLVDPGDICPPQRPPNSTRARRNDVFPLLSHRRAQIVHAPWPENSGMILCSSHIVLVALRAHEAHHGNYLTNSGIIL